MSLRNKILTVRRIGQGSYDQTDEVGFFKKNSADEIFTIKCSIQPITGSETKLLPENRREETAFKIFTSTELKCAEKGDSGNSDIIEISGVDYEVVKVIPWQNSVIDYYKVIIQKRTTNDLEPTEVVLW